MTSTNLDLHVGLEAIQLVEKLQHGPLHLTVSSLLTVKPGGGEEQERWPHCAIQSQRRPTPVSQPHASLFPIGMHQLDECTALQDNAMPHQNSKRLSFLLRGKKTKKVMHTLLHLLKLYYMWILLCEPSGQRIETK